MFHLGRTTKMISYRESPGWSFFSHLPLLTAPFALNNKIWFMPGGNGEFTWGEWFRLSSSSLEIKMRSLIASPRMVVRDLWRHMEKFAFNIFGYRVLAMMNISAMCGVCSLGIAVVAVSPGQMLVINVHASLASSWQGQVFFLPTRLFLASTWRQRDKPTSIIAGNSESFINRKLCTRHAVAH